MDSVCIGGINVRVHRFNTIVVGSGAAGLNAAEFIHRNGQPNIALITENITSGTSRNTGSDKQTYYKLSLSGNTPDSITQTALTLFNGGAMDGDIALAEAASSARCFYHLVELGVPFPHNPSGEYIGYKTDHDPVTRGTSAGPLTSKFMTERLFDAVQKTGMPIFDKHQIIQLLVEPDKSGGKKTVGALALNLAEPDSPDTRYTLFLATNIVYATGGEAGMYAMSVYPPSQNGGSGVAFRAGCVGKNLTESQYGITSTKFRWNLSGTYQQVLPRYISTNADGGDPREFLDEHFPSPQKLLTAIFLKGYQWPFDPRKIQDHGSSLIDILVHNEIMFKGRRVFLDYRANPSCAEKTQGELDASLLEETVGEYLGNSGAIFGTPIQRLEKMNPAAIELYASHSIDLRNELLEIAVSAQHNNGGLSANKWWESEIRHFFPVGEVNGTHGVYRPGGSALNSGQVGGVRAGEYIVNRYREEPVGTGNLSAECLAGVAEAIRFGEDALEREGRADLAEMRREIGMTMSRYGAHIRSAEGVERGLCEIGGWLGRLAEGVGIGSVVELRRLHQVRDIAVCGFMYLSAIRDYIGVGGGSRGSYLVHREGGVRVADGLPEEFVFVLDSGELVGRVQESVLEGGICVSRWRDVRPMPDAEEWFETEWARYRSGAIYD